jgi:hypothetical protein
MQRNVLGNRWSSPMAPTWHPFKPRHNRRAYINSSTLCYSSGRMRTVAPRSYFWHRALHRLALEGVDSLAQLSQLPIHHTDIRSNRPLQSSRNSICSCAAAKHGPSCFKSCRNATPVVLVRARRLLVDSRVCPVISSPTDVA